VRALLVAVVATLSACASTGERAPPGGEGQGSIVVDGRTGAVLSEAEVTRRLRAARVVLVGEEHANPAFHAVQRVVLERVVAVETNGSHHIVVGVEWLPRSSEGVLDDFLNRSPQPPIAELRSLVDWDEVWGHDFDAYAALFETARRVHVRIVPLNAEPGLARVVARGGVAGVPPERAAELPPLDSGNEAQREWFRARMEAAAEGHPGHALSGEALDRMYLAQLVWDETMARSVIAAIVSPAAATETRQVVVFAGMGHVEYGLGIPARLGGLTHLVIVPVVSLEDARSRVRDAAMPEREADLFWLVHP